MRNTHQSGGATEMPGNPQGRGFEQCFDALMMAIPDVLLRIDADGRFIDVSAAQPQLLALPPQDLIGKTLRQIWPEEKAAFHLRHIRQCIRTNTVICYEYPLIVFDGSLRYFEARLSRVNAQEVVSVIRDITARKQAEEHLRKLDHQVIEHKRNTDFLLNQAPDSVIILDEHGRVTYWNNKSTEMFGWAADEVIGRPVEQFIIPEGLRKKHLHGLAGAGKDGLSRQSGKVYVLPAHHKNGQLLFVSLTISQSVVEGKIAFTAFLRDITAQIKAKQQLEKKEKQLTEAQAIAKIGSFEWDVHSRQVYCSDELLHIFEMDKESFRGRCAEFARHIYAPDRNRLKKINDDFVKNRLHPEFGFRIKTSSGRLKYIRIKCGRTEEEKGRPVIFGMLQDVTEQKHYERRIFQAAVDSEEKERMRIAAELHDGVNQHLAATKLTIETALREPDAEWARRLLARAAVMVNEAIQMNRKVSHDLMPGDHFEHGFLPALQQLVTNLNQVDAIVYHLSIEGKEPTLDAATCQHLYRVVQEFIRNAQKHAQATRLFIEISFIGKQLLMVLADNGIGFDLERQQKKGVGMMSMQNRLKAIGALYEYRSNSGKGTELVVRVPLV